MCKEERGCVRSLRVVHKLLESRESKHSLYKLDRRYAVTLYIIILPMNSFISSDAQRRPSSDFNAVLHGKIFRFSKHDMHPIIQFRDAIIESVANRYISTNITRTLSILGRVNFARISIHNLYLILTLTTNVTRCSCENCICELSKPTFLSAHCLRILLLET